MKDRTTCCSHNLLVTAQFNALAAAAGFSPSAAAAGGEGRHPYQAALELMGITAFPGTSDPHGSYGAGGGSGGGGLRHSSGSFGSGGGFGALSGSGAALSGGGPAGFGGSPGVMSGNHGVAAAAFFGGTGGDGAFGSGTPMSSQKRGRDNAFATAAAGFDASGGNSEPPSKRHAHLRQILDSGGNPWMDAAGGGHASLPGAAIGGGGGLPPRAGRVATSSGMLMPPPGQPSGYYNQAHSGGNAGGQLPGGHLPGGYLPQGFGLSAAMTDPMAAAAAAAAAWGGSGGPQAGGGRSLIDNYLPAATTAALAYAAHARGLTPPFSPPRLQGQPGLLPHGQRHGLPPVPPSPFGAAAPPGGPNLAAGIASLAGGELSPSYGSAEMLLRRASGMSTPRGSILSRASAPSPISPSEARLLRHSFFCITLNVLQRSHGPKSAMNLHSYETCSSPCCRVCVTVAGGGLLP